MKKKRRVYAEKYINVLLVVGKRVDGNRVMGFGLFFFLDIPPIYVCFSCKWVIK